MSAIAAIQVKRRQIGLEDEDWRDFLERETGQRSVRALKPREQTLLLQRLDEMLGPKVQASKPPRKRLEGPYSPKIQALWIACWNLALVQSRTDTALTAFVRRQTGIDNPAWMHDPAAAKKVIEALKAMLSRRGVRWSFSSVSPLHICRPGYQVALAQYKLIDEPASFGSWVLEMSGKHLEMMGHQDWIPIMNRLGTRVRELARQGRLPEGQA